MTDRDRRLNAEIERNIATDVAVGESIKRGIAEQRAQEAAIERDLAEQQALEAQITAEDSRRMTQNLAASSAMANQAADAAQRSSFATGVIALFVVVGLLLGGIVLYNNYRTKNDQLYSANVQNDRHRTENRVLRETADQEARRADAATQAAVSAAVSQPAPEVQVKVTAPTPAPQPPANINVVVPPANPADRPLPDAPAPAPEITPSDNTTTSENAENDKTSVTVTTESNP